MPVDLVAIVDVTVFVDTVDIADVIEHHRHSRSS